MRTLRRFALVIFLFFWMLPVGSPTAAAEPESHASNQFSLQGTWRMQSSCVDKSSPEAISTAGFTGSGWHKAEIPGTVVGALVFDGTFPDPNYGMNLKSYPGMNYTARLFANADMPADSPFRCSYWFPRNSACPQDSRVSVTIFISSASTTEPTSGSTARRSPTAARLPALIAPSNSPLANS